MSEWYQTWFNQLYVNLYAHRNKEQSTRQVEFLLKETVLQSKASILDIACGTGRHLEVFLKKGYQAWGMDLSLDLLNLVQNPSHIIRADMAQIPFKGNHFDLVTSFFSSFGYFKSEKLDLLLLKSMVTLMKEKGWLFLDLAHKDFVISNLVSQDEKEEKGYHIVQKRSFQNNVVTKDIIVKNEKGEVQTYQENLRLYSLSEIKTILDQYDLKIKKIYGTELGDKFDKYSPRMSFLFQKL